MTATEMKDKLKIKSNEAWDTYQLYIRTFGKDDAMTQRALGKWIGYDDLYKELYGENAY
jgi:hypothetical protein|nr:MAG TPA: hypothetical protein [Caudoviricetes sp.]